MTFFIENRRSQIHPDRVQIFNYPQDINSDHLKCSAFVIGAKTGGDGRL